MPNFNQDWFSDAIPVFNAYLKDLKGKDNLVFLEIGSYEGRSAYWLLENILTGNNCGLFCVDDFSGSRVEKENGLSTSFVKDRLINNLKPFEGKYQILEGKSQDVLRLRNDLEGKIDVVYVDGSHTASDTLEDMITAFRLLKNGGIMFIDDYLWNFNRYPVEDVPKTAIDSFIQCFKNKIKVVTVTFKTVVLKKL